MCQYLRDRAAGKTRGVSGELEMSGMRNDGNQCHIIAALQVLRGLHVKEPRFGALLARCGLFGEILASLLQGSMSLDMEGSAKLYIEALVQGVDSVGTYGTPAEFFNAIFDTLVEVAPPAIKVELQRDYMYRYCSCNIIVCKTCWQVSVRWNSANAVPADLECGTWHPSRHHQFPDTFRPVAVAVMLLQQRLEKRAVDVRAGDQAAPAGGEVDGSEQQRTRGAGRRGGVACRHDTERGVASRPNRPTRDHC